MAINSWDDEKSARTFVEEAKLAFPVLMDRESTAKQQYYAWTFPLFYLIDQKGMIVGSGYGSKGRPDWGSETAKQLIQALLTARPE